MRHLYAPIAFLAAVALACTLTPTPTADLNEVVSQTLAAATVEAALTQSVPTETLQPPPPPSDTPSPTPEEVAPDPLPGMNTGIILDNGQCFNFDNGQTTTPDTECDVWLAEPALFRQLNGAQISGYVTMTPPTRSQCVAGRYEPGDLAVQTDLYMCFISNQGRVGFIVVRAYRGGIPATGIEFDYWTFQ